MGRNLVNEIMNMNKQTPNIIVTDNQGGMIKGIAYCKSSVAESIPTENVTYILRNSQNLTTTAFDARFYLSLQSNKSENKKNQDTVFNNKTYFSITGHTLREENCDAGTRLALFNVEGNLVWSAEMGTAVKGVCRSFEYDKLNRVIAAYEKGKEESTFRCIERNSYGDTDGLNNSILTQQKNQRGRLTCSNKIEGTVWYNLYSILGGLLNKSWAYFSQDNLDKPLNWPLLGEERDKLLELDSNDKPIIHNMTFEYNAVNNLTQLTDIFKNTLEFKYDELGMPAGGGNLYLQLTSQEEKTELNILKSITYNAEGSLTQEVFVNGIQSNYEYDVKSRHLTCINSFSKSNSLAFRELNYFYDPMGHIIRIDKDHLRTEKRIIGQNQQFSSEYTYDTLYKLSSATGYEIQQTEGNQASKSPLILPKNVVSKDENLQYYKESYTYDPSNNLSKILHQTIGENGASEREVSFHLSVSNKNNQAIQGENIRQSEIEKHFDSDGNLTEIEDKQTLEWDNQNNLKSVTEKRNGKKCSEKYYYDSSGIRVLKIIMEDEKIVAKIRYMPGMEIRYNPKTQKEDIVILKFSQSSMTIRVILKRFSDDAVNFEKERLVLGMRNHLPNITHLIDEEGGILCQREYHPYGTTAFEIIEKESTGADLVPFFPESFSGKEKDATGFNYFGGRYFNSTEKGPKARWLNPDPTGLRGSGLNRYEFCYGNPIHYFDPDGFAPPDAQTRRPPFFDFVIDYAKNRRSDNTYEIVIFELQETGGSNLYNPDPEDSNTWSLLFPPDAKVLRAGRSKESAKFEYVGSQRYRQILKSYLKTRDPEYRGQAYPESKVRWIEHKSLKNIDYLIKDTSGSGQVIDSWRLKGKKESNRFISEVLNDKIKQRMLFNTDDTVCQFMPNIFILGKDDLSHNPNRIADEIKNYFGNSDIIVKKEGAEGRGNIFVKGIQNLTNTALIEEITKGNLPVSGIYLIEQISNIGVGSKSSKSYRAVAVYDDEKTFFNVINISKEHTPQDERNSHCWERGDYFTSKIPFMITRTSKTSKFSDFAEDKGNMIETISYPPSLETSAKKHRDLINHKVDLYNSFHRVGELLKRYYDNPKLLNNFYKGDFDIKNLDEIISVQNNKILFSSPQIRQSLLDKINVTNGLSKNIENNRAANLQALNRISFFDRIRFSIYNTQNRWQNRTFLRRHSAE